MASLGERALVTRKLCLRPEAELPDSKQLVFEKKVVINALDIKLPASFKLAGS
jgi:hypothetical protein